MTDEEKQALLRQLRAKQTSNNSSANEDLGTSSSPLDFGLSDQDKQAVGDYASNGIDYEKQARLAALREGMSKNPYEDLMNGTFRDTGRVAAHPGEYLDSVIGAPVRSSIAQMQKGDFDIDPIGQMGKDPKNAPTNVDLAENMGIKNPYLGAAVATGLDLTAQLPIGEIASAGKALPGIVGAVEDVSKLKGLGRASKEGEALSSVRNPALNDDNYLYHITPKENAEAIMKEGIKPGVGKRTLSGHSEIGDDSPHGAFFSEKPLLDEEDPQHNADYSVFRVPKNDNRLYQYDGYGVKHLKSGRYYENEDLNGLVPVGAEEGDHFSLEPIEAEHVPQTVQQGEPKGQAGKFALEDPDTKLMTSKELRKNKIERPMEHLAEDDMPVNKLGEEDPENPWEEADYNYRLNGVPDTRFLVKDGEVIGHVGLDDDNKIKAAYINPEYQGQGYGKDMYRHLFNDGLAVKSDDLNAMEPGAKGIWDSLRKEMPDSFKKTKNGYTFTPPEKLEVPQAPAGRFSSLKKMVGTEPSSAQALIDSVKTPEKAAALSPEARQKYLEALDEVHGPRDQRAKDLGFSPETYYHGSFGDIDKMKPAGKDNFLGQSVYTTSNPADASYNYADKEGPDFNIKVNRLFNELREKNPGMSSTEAHEKVMESLTGGRDSGAVYPVRIRSENPVDLGSEYGKDGRNWIDVHDTANQVRQENGMRKLSNDSRRPGEALRQALVEKGNDAAFIRPDEQWRDFPEIQPDDVHAMLFNPNQVRSTNAAFDPRFKDSTHLLAGKLGGGDLEDAAKVSRFQKLKDLLGIVDTPEKAAALTGEERQAYLKALDEQYGPRDKRAKDLGFGDKTFYHGTSGDIKAFDPDKVGDAGREHPESYWASRNPEVADEFAKHSSMGKFLEATDDPEHPLSSLADELNQKLEIQNEKYLKADDEGDQAGRWYAEQEMQNIQDKLDALKHEHGANVMPVRLRGNPYVHDARGSHLDEDEVNKILNLAKKKGNDSAIFKHMSDDPSGLNLKSTVGTVFNPNQIRSENAAFDPRFKDSANLLAGQLGPSNLSGANLTAALSPDLQKIAQIESSGGKNKKHEMTHVGLNAGDTAGGSTGMMPIMAQEILRKNPELAKKYPKLTTADHDEITNAINSNPAMESELANAHWDRLNKVFGGDTARMAYAWRNGITAAKKASDIQVQEHPYVQKFMNGEPARFSRLKSILGN